MRTPPCHGLRLFNTFVALGLATLHESSLRTKFYLADSSHSQVWPCPIRIGIGYVYARVDR